MTSSPDLAERVKRLKAVAEPFAGEEWTVAASVNCGDVYVKHGKSHTLADTEARAAYIAAANPRAVSAILDELERVTVAHTDACARERALSGERDAANRGRMEWFERATAAEAKATTLERELAEVPYLRSQNAVLRDTNDIQRNELAEAKAGARTPGTVEVCPMCGVPLAYENGDKGSIDGCNGWQDPVEGGPVIPCGMKRAHSPAATGRTSPVTDEELMDCYQHSGPAAMEAGNGR